MFDWLTERNPAELTGGAVVLRLVLACLFSGVLGIERTLKRRAAGFRTYMLVCMGATLVMMTGLYVLGYGATSDSTRLGAQVVSGIGFLGAGTIMLTGHYKIRGLTTAAGLWAAACIGLALGAGFYLGAIVMCVMVLVVMVFFGRLQTSYLLRSRRVRLYVVFETLGNLMSFMDFLKEKQIAVSEFETHEPDNRAGVGAFFTVRFAEKKTHAEILELVRGCEGLTFIEEL